MGLINPGVGTTNSSSTALLTSIALLITNEYNSKLKLRYTKLRDWINVITLLYEKTLKNSMVDQKIDQKKLRNSKRFIIITLTKEIMKNTRLRVEDNFGKVKSKDDFSQEQKTKLNNFLAKIM